MARGQSLRVTKKHISAVSSSSYICLLYYTLGLLGECANISDKDMNDMDIEGGFRNNFENVIRMSSDNHTFFEWSCSKLIFSFRA